MQWGRKNGGVKTTLNVQLIRMKIALNRAKTSGKINIDENIVYTWRDAIADFGLAMEEPEKFMRKSAFYAFVKGERKTPLGKRDSNILEAFYHEHVGQHEHWDV